MAKRSQQRPARYEKDQAGCIWGFISIFDFRYGRSTRRLLSDRRRPSRQVIGAGFSESKLQMLTNSNEPLQVNYDGEERGKMIADFAKTRVKELIEEEIFSEKDQKGQVSAADTEAKESDSELRGRAKKNRKGMRKSSKSSGDIHFELDAAKKLGPENTFHQNPEGKSLKNLDLEVVVNELCQHACNKNANCAEHDLNNDKLIEAIKVLLDNRFTDGKNLSKDRKIESSKDFVKALRTSSSNKELILELLKDPTSLLVKHIGELGDSQLAEDRNSNSLAESNMLDGDLKSSKPSLPAARKQHSFFRRKSKSQENISLEGDETYQASNRIVILKPVPTGIQISGTERKMRSSSRSHFDLRTEAQTQRNASQFSFAEIKRKIKQAIGKESNEVPSTDLTYRFPYERQNSGNSERGNVREKGGWNSPNRNHFYNERFARPATGIKNKEKSCKPKDSETSMGNETVEYPEQRVSNIYIEAKKHLYEMLSNDNESEDFSSAQLPKTLGRILSLPEFNFSPICSPGRNNEHKFVTAQERLVPYKNTELVIEDTWQHTEENNAEVQSCISDDSEDKVQSCNLNSDVLNELNHADEVEDTSCPVPDKRSDGDVVILQTVDALVKEESNVLEISAEQCSSSVIIDDQNSDLDEVCDEEGSLQCLKFESFEQDQQETPTSPASSLINKHVGDQDSASERPERPSPVSVLEPLFTEDDVSPASIKSQPSASPLQPLRIHFEEQISSTNQAICIGTCMEDDESTFEYVEAVLLASDLNWEQFLLRWLSSDQVLDPSLFDEVELFSNRSYHDQKLLFDCTNEVLTEVCERYFGYSPCVSFVKRNIRPIPRGKDLIDEVWEGVGWHLLPRPSPCTLDQIVRKDMARPQTWMDLRNDVESIGIAIEEAVFEELVKDTILSFVNEVPETDSSVLPAELIEIE